MAILSDKTLSYEIMPAGDGFVLYSHGGNLSTPAGKALCVPTPALAEALAAERHAENGKNVSRRMPITQLAYTALDVVALQKNRITEQIAAYAETELLCHRADYPAELAERQHRLWQPVLAWCSSRFNAEFKVGSGVMPIPQESETVASLRQAIASYDNFTLAGLQQAVALTGSLILGVALMEGHLSVGKIMECVELDSDYQAEKWGENPTTSARRESLQNDLGVCDRWFRLLRAKV